MIITLKKNAPEEEVKKIREHFESMNLRVNMIKGDEYNVFGLVGDTARLDERKIMANQWVENVQRVSAPYKLANRMFHPEDSVVDVAGIPVGGESPVVVIGGPCSVEGEEQAVRIAKEVKEAGGCMLRGGAYKPRTSPYSFQGLGYEGIVDLVKAREKTGLPIVSELMSVDKIDEFEENVDLVQIGARNMQNFDLLKAVGHMHKPILLKRGMSATIEDWIMSAEYIMANGNPNVILCERGIRTFEKYTRNTMDLAVIPIIKEKTHLPIIIDPSHSTGNWKYVEAVSLAAVAAGADGLIIEVHDHPDEAWSDGAQSLKPEKFAQLIKKARKIAAACGRPLR
ncbi:MAG: 3-deoxy-7-phosphoheptulonate synthase [Solobacterium sp.]|jgi:3-deoxy-7-phosphoheptulonate synthase|nr:3-deoxy-7-phosphoheptulonate synthase [Solobacterium sp.]MCH4048282.1 3-deoxy-7-phosphoheptulonate synthase [Solobacterium sp.]MCH4074865.1 3-deoxy-7-phosphoheptulonate synthase [Solobacterium sp.]MCI1314252.1 3-deoxy-7-phosphoheptulonate synthase [Solobacterium sp.]MCI1346327.1 3-deoxy-7-phosphoheptulonate synthase [Solobacterium sp.]